MELEQACGPGHERHYIYNRRQGNSNEARDVLLYYVDQLWKELSETGCSS